MSYNPEYYGPAEVQGTPRELLDTEINVVKNIEEEAANKESMIVADESVYPPQEVAAPRELLETEINVVENIKSYESRKSEIITQADEEVQMHELLMKLNQLTKDA